MSTPKVTPQTAYNAKRDAEKQGGKAVPYTGNVQYSTGASAIQIDRLITLGYPEAVKTWPTRYLPIRDLTRRQADVLLAEWLGAKAWGVERREEATQ